jgi:hypothetical protein
MVLLLLYEVKGTSKVSNNSQRYPSGQKGKKNYEYQNKTGKG